MYSSLNPLKIVVLQAAEEAILFKIAAVLFKQGRMEEADSFDQLWIPSLYTQVYCSLPDAEPEGYSLSSLRNCLHMISIPLDAIDAHGHYLFCVMLRLILRSDIRELWINVNFATVSQREQQVEFDMDGDVRMAQFLSEIKFVHRKTKAREVHQEDLATQIARSDKKKNKHQAHLLDTSTHKSEQDYRDEQHRKDVMRVPNSLVPFLP